MTDDENIPFGMFISNNLVDSFLTPDCESGGALRIRIQIIGKIKNGLILGIDPANAVNDGRLCGKVIDRLPQRAGLGLPVASDAEPLASGRVDANACDRADLRGGETGRTHAPLERRRDYYRHITVFQSTAERACLALPASA